MSPLDRFGQARLADRGWRFEQFGKDALDLVEGRLAFAIENGKLKMSRVVEQEERVDA